MSALEDGITVQFALTPETVVTHNYRQTGEDEWAETPITLVEAVVERIADKMIGNVEKAARERFGGSTYDSYSGIVNSKIGPAVDARVEAIVTDLMEKELTRTTAYGKPVGEPTTLEEVITERVEKWLTTATGDRYNKDRKSPLEAALAKLVDRQMTAALDKVIAEAQQKALATVSATAEQALVQGLRTTIAKMAAA